MSRHRAASGTPADESGGRFTTTQLAALTAAIAAHDTIDLDAPAPATVHLDYDIELLERCYRLSCQLWEDFDRAALTRLASRLSLGRHLTAADMRTFKDIRARSKQLRFARQTLGAGHAYPPLLDRVTRLMGQAQDAGRTGRRLKAVVRGVQLRFMSTRSHSAALLREARSFVATDSGAFRSQVLRQIDQVRSALAGPAISNRAFHDTRKVVSRLVAFYDTLTVLAPSEYHSAVDHYLSTINGLMGSLHDHMVVRKARNRLDYEQLVEPLPPEIADRLHQLVDAFPKS